jgi:hypothetical protein
MTPQQKIGRSPEDDRKEDNSYFKHLSGLPMWVVFIMLPFLLGSCEAVAGIFKAGMGFGILLVVAFIITIGVLFMRMGKNKNH